MSSHVLISTSKPRAIGPRKILVKDKTFGVWHLWTTPPPTSVTDTMDLTARRAHYLQLYGDMPRLQNSPGEQYVREASQVLQYILEKNDRPGDFEWAAKEFANVRKMRSKTGKNAILSFDQETREFMGCLTLDAEPKPTAAMEDRILEQRWFDKKGNPVAADDDNWNDLQHWPGGVNVTDAHYKLSLSFMPERTPEEVKRFIIDGIGQGPFNVDHLLSEFEQYGDQGDLQRTDKGWVGLEWSPDDSLPDPIPEPKDEPATSATPKPVAAPPKADIETDVTGRDPMLDELDDPDGYYEQQRLEWEYEMSRIQSGRIDPREFGLSTVK